MVAVVAGMGLGLNTGSARVLGNAGSMGLATFGRQSDRLYVNAATGNLVVQARDELLAGRGPDALGLRTYNSLGSFVDDNGDNWQPGLARKVWLSGGTQNATGSTATRRDEDGSEAIFNWDAASGRYVSTDGDGAHDTLSYDTGSGNWTYTEGTSRLTEVYAGGNGRLLSATDADGNALSFAYNAAGLVSSVTTAAGESTFYDYNASNQLTQLRTVTKATASGAADQTLTRVRYGYDASNRLQTVSVDLSPTDNSIADGQVFTTTYAYDGTSKRIASISQSDGAKVSFTYDASQRVLTVTDAVGGVTSFSYDSTNRATTVTDPLSQATTYRYDISGRLTSVTSPAVAGVSSVTSYDYNAAGDVIRITDAEGRAVSMDVDTSGNWIRQTDAAGNVIRRAYNAQNQLTAESVATAGEPAASTPATRHVYDSSGVRLRYLISAEGRVTEYRYDSLGQRTSTIDYAGASYGLAGAAWNSVPTEATLNAWASAQDLSRTQRTDFAYDWRGQLQRSTRYDSVDASGNGQGASATQYVYDAEGLLLKTVDPRSGVTQHTYDGLGRELTATNALNQVSVNRYDDVGGVVRTSAFNGLLTTSTFDKLGHLVSVVDSAQPDPAAAFAASANAAVNGGSLVKTGGIDGWTDGAYSKQGIAGGASVSFRPAQANKAFAVGLNTDPSADHSLAGIDWALSGTASGVLQIYENGSYQGDFGTYAADDQLAVTYDGGTLRYLRNGQVLRSVSTAITQPLYADSSLYGVGAKLTGLRFESFASSGNVLVADGGVTMSGREITKTSGTDGAWDCSFRSTAGYTGGASLTFRAAQTDKQIAIGLNTDPTTNASYNSIDWQMTLGPNGELFIAERVDGGLFVDQFGTYAAGDLLGISYDGAAIRYTKNGQVLRTLAKTITQPLYADSSFNRVGAKVYDVSFGPSPVDPGTFLTEGQMTVMGREITKTGGSDSAWDGAFRSAVGYQGGASVTFRAAQANKQIAVGLNTDPTTNASYNSIDWQMTLGPNGELFIAERVDGSFFVDQFGTYAAGDLLGISYDGTAIRYTKNGQVLRSVTKTITQPLYADSSFARIGARLYDVSFEGGGTVLDGVRSYYDADSQLRMTLDAKGTRHWYFYDEAGRKVGEVDGLGHTTEFLYNKAGQITQRIEYGALANTSALIDAAGQPTSTAFSAVRPATGRGDVRQWSAYDSAGRLSKTVTAAGEVSEFTYDAGNRLLLTRHYASTIDPSSLGASPAPGAIAPTAGSQDLIERHF